MSRRAAILLLLALAGILAFLLLITRSQAPAGARKRRPFLRVTPAPARIIPSVAGTAPAATPSETVRVTLFFPGVQDGKLRPEERDLPKPSGAGAFFKALFAELQKGPNQEGLVRILPEKMQLRTAFLLPGGEIVLDLAVDAGLSFGSAEELAIVASLVNTVLQNAADTSRVRILVNGEPAESLGGHLDLTRPLLYMRGELAS